MPSFEVSSEFLALMAGALLSLAFSYIPGLSTRFAGLLPEIKRLIMLGLLLLVAVIIYAGTCANLLSSDILCDQSGVLRLVYLLITAVIANQSTYSITPQSDNVRLAATKSREGNQSRCVEG